MGTHKSVAQAPVVADQDPTADGEAIAPGSALRIDGARRHLLVDEPTGLLISGCDPTSTVVVTASADVDGAVHEATATFEADERGVVDTARHASSAGAYRGVDAFGLWWSGRATTPSGATPPTPIGCRVRAEAGRQVVECAFERHWLAPGATVTEVRDGGVWGLFARPAGPGPFPAVVAFGGSGGGLGPAAAWAPVLAAHGLATLAVAYFGVSGLPDALVRLDVETVERAVAWLYQRADVAPGPLAVVGMSRGSELALLAGAFLDGVGAVVAFAPSGVSWAGLDSGGPVDAPAWRFRGQDIPYAGGGRPARVDTTISEQPVALRPGFEAFLQKQDAIHAAEIPVERVKGPILLVSGEADAMWPSTPMAEIVERRAANNGFAHHLIHLRYPDAGHICAGVPGTPVVTDVHHPLTGGFFSFGGSRAGNAAARADSWPRVVSFLTDSLTGS